MYQQIALAADGSDNSMRAAQEAIKIAKLSPDAAITLLYVIDIDKAKTEVLHATSAESLYLERRAKIASVEAVLEAAGVRYTIEMLNGMPGPAIVDYVNTHSIDLIVIGSRGLNSLQQMVLGSVSHKVMKRVTCPALIVK